MFVMLYAVDKPGQQELRTSLKQQHSARLNEGAAGLRLLLSGPLLDEAGREIGSLGVLEAKSCDQVATYLSEDPYVKAGLFETVVIREWLWRRGNPHV
jgi:uncharacterized protein